MAISLGRHDSHLTKDALRPFIEAVRAMSGNLSDELHDDGGPAVLKPISPREALSVSELQHVLVDAGFLPGGRIDGICGYRTRSAIRLFQEYVRSVEARDCTPDGIAGPKTYTELKRWADAGIVANWKTDIDTWADDSLAAKSGEYTNWLDFLELVKGEAQRSPSPMLELVNAFTGDTDTRRVDEWAFSKHDIHLVGIRHDRVGEPRIFDDQLLLLIKGLVFVFQATTDPGHSSHPDGAPFLVDGQHAFHIGLHRGSYHALRPLHHDRHGVLVVRSKDDKTLEHSDLESGLEVNGTINIHWGGKGVNRQVNRWSEGCQVITGSGYRNHLGSVVDCSSYVAINNGEVIKSGSRRTRGAYNVLSDLIVAMSGDLPRPGEVLYTLLSASTLLLDKSITERVTADRVAGLELMHRLG